MAGYSKGKFCEHIVLPIYMYLFMIFNRSDPNQAKTN